MQCDEGKPECEKCRNYGVSCNYDGTETENLQLSGEGAFFIEPAIPAVPQPPADMEVELPPTPPSDFILGMLGYPLKMYDSDEVYHMKPSDLDLLQWFHERTVLTMGTAETVHVYKDLMVVVGCQHDYLTHVVLALAMMHQRYYSDGPYEPLELESFHGFHGTALFNSMLFESPEESEKDALWACAAMLGALSLAGLNARTAAECWPLREPSAEDLDWLRMSDGKKAVWKLADPLRESSIWRKGLQFNLKERPIPQTARVPQMDALYPFLTKLYDFDESAHNDGDPYYTATSIIVRLLPIDPNHSTILYFLSFIGHMDPAYKNLLHQKDPKAMLLLAWWYAKVLDYNVWWMYRRVSLECKAICVYLNNRFMPDSEIGRLLEFPKMKCGMAVRSCNWT